jgi:hypothetical protein
MGPHLDPAQRVFVAWVNHQLRGRLHLADAYAESLAGRSLDPAGRRDVAALLTVTRQLLETLDELLDGDLPPAQP